jgi:asparagine N-glycosylation enzyme membrane subunit Stt3
MDKGYIFAIILIAIIFLDVILKVTTKKTAVIQLVTLVAAVLILLAWFFIDGMKNGYQYPYLIFILLGIIGFFRKYGTYKSQKFN